VSATLSKIFRLKREEIKTDWRGLPNEELYDLYSSPNIAPVMKLRRMEWEARVTYMGTGQAHSRFWWGNLWEKYHLEDLGIDVEILRQLQYTELVGRGGGVDWTGQIWLRIETHGGLL
jgi:hypothetical protein